MRHFYRFQIDKLALALQGIHTFKFRSFAETQTLQRVPEHQNVLLWVPRTSPRTVSMSQRAGNEMFANRAWTVEKIVRSSAKGMISGPVWFLCVSCIQGQWEGLISQGLLSRSAMVQAETNGDDGVQLIAAWTNAGSQSRNYSYVSSAEHWTQWTRPEWASTSIVLTRAGFIAVSKCTQPGNP